MNYFIRIIFSICIFFPFCTTAKGSEKLIYDKYITESSKCAAHFKRAEKKHQIPSDILHSISLQESGRRHEKLDKIIPWPWSVNVEGKGYYFNSKNAAASFIKQQMLFGKKSIDVGCMQINLYHHPNAFASVSEALDPKSNIEYGAQFLREKYEQFGSWKKAIANYHSANNKLGLSYRNSVLKIASNIDKNKFDYFNSYGNINHGSAQKTEQKNKSIIRSDRKRDRYKSNMMVYVPQNLH